MANFYQILGLPNFAPISDVRKSFRKMAVQYHPDKHGGEKIYEEKFKSINLAYQTLGDPRKKELYDQKLLYSNTFFQTKKTKPQTTASKHKTGRRYEPIVNETKQPNKRKPKALKHTKLQKQLIGITLGIIPIFIFIAAWITNNSKESNPRNELSSINTKLANLAKNNLDSPNFLLSKPFIDSLEFINRGGMRNTELQHELINKQAYLLKGLIKKNQHYEIIKESLILTELLDHYSITANPFFNLNLVNSYFETGDFKKGDTLLKDILKNSRLSINNSLFLSDILLKNNIQPEANIIINRNKTYIFKRFFNTYGANFYKQISQETVDEAIMKELVQFSCINANTENEAYSLLHKFIEEKLKESDHHTFYSDLMKIDFKKKNVTNDFKDRYKKSLKFFNLEKYYN